MKCLQSEGNLFPMAERLSSLDGSFLRVETSNAHMHVAWAALLEPSPERPRPTLPELRRSIECRLERTPRFRRRLGFAPPGWVSRSGSTTTAS